ncbi:unnamed protein product [Toxocara canis]|nr:unnamed protein product [Toxocara canis]
MTATLSAHDQASLSAATAMFSQCSLDDASEAFEGSYANLDRRYLNKSNGSINSRIQRRNAVGNLFEGVDLAFIKQLAAAAPIGLQ